MPNIGTITARKRKKLDLAEYFNEEAWIYIKIIPRTVKKRMEMLSLDAMTSKLAMKINEGIQNGDIAEDDNIDSTKMAVIIGNLNPEDKKQIEDATRELETLTLESGVDEKEHNFVDEKSNPVLLTPEVWDTMPIEVTNYVIAQVNDFNTGFSLGKPIIKTST